MGKSNVDAAEFESSNGDDKNTDRENDDISMLIERVARLENTVSEITEQQTELTHHMKKQSEDMEDMTDSIENLRNKLNELESQEDIQDSRINNINRSLDNLEEDLQDTKGEIEEKTNMFENRLKAIENMMDIDQMDIAKAVKPEACELEQLSTIPETSRKDQFTVRVQRAIALYENFQQISTPVKSGGKRVLSKDIKTFLNGYANTDIKYTQVQRVIDSFYEKTGDEYDIQNTSDGRAIVWNPEDS